jgi:superfamily II DNA or RNA helicase
MSRLISQKSLSDMELETMEKELLVKVEPGKYSKVIKKIYPYDIKGDTIYVPFMYKTEYPRPARTTFPVMNVSFNGELRPKQKVVKKEAIIRMNKHGSSVVAAHMGFGKSPLALYIASKIKLRTMIVAHRIILINQWKATINRFLPDATVQILTAKTEMNDSDFYIMNATNIPKRGRQYQEIGLVIVDELHLIMAGKLSESLSYLRPRYLLGLSATPYRMDGLNKLIDLYFGEHRIIRKLNRYHLVYKVDTGFIPEFTMAVNGRVNWSSVLESQAEDHDRNELIIRIIKQFKERVFLVLCKRVIQGRYLVKRLQEEEEDVTSLIGKQQTFSHSSRILVGTTGKCSTGFDHPRLNTLLLAGDIQQYYIQSLGRIMRREDSEPIVFDLVDKNPILFRHYMTRRDVYMEHGGVIKNFPLL